MLRPIGGLMIAMDPYQDMYRALIGGGVGLIGFGRVHDRSMARLPQNQTLGTS